MHSSRVPLLKIELPPLHIVPIDGHHKIAIFGDRLG